ncbi:MAG: hypothetical protein AMJ55_01900 [Gammaproteobacteria bacterium SG8_15]|nr:MAG: hypothetical protein AMJ55_01900 [Gammaproteobacteria bacterium SG8_15]
MQDHDEDTDDKYLSDIYASLKQEQPSSEQDEKILAAARKPVATDDAAVTKSNSSLIPKKAAGPFSGRWAVPVSLAAVIVLSVTLVVMIERERPYSLTSEPEPARMEQKNQPLELAKPVEKRQSAQAIAKESVQSADEKAEAARLEMLQESELALLQRAAPSSASPAQPRADARDSEKSASGVSARPVQESAPAPQQKAKPKQVPVQELVDVDVARNITTDSSVSAKREAPALSVAAGNSKAKTETQPPVAKFDDAVATSESDESVAQATAAPVVEQDQVASAATASAEDDAVTSEEAHIDTPPSVARSVSEAAPSESKKPIALAATAPASTAPQIQRQDVAVESMAEAGEEPSEEQGTALAQQPQQERPMSEGEPAAPASIAIAKTKEEQTPTKEATSMSPEASPSRALAKSEGLELQCRQMGQQACLISPSCILEQQAADKSYQCRTAANACETNFSQSLGGKDDCEKRPECQYVPADCYCAPGQDCPCTGGAPAMCVPKPVGE